MNLHKSVIVKRSPEVWLTSPNFAAANVSASDAKRNVITGLTDIFASALIVNEPFMLFHPSSSL